ncbi:hypothetical protein GCM10028807_60140 [Spirosoma daeguense]
MGNTDDKNPQLPEGFEHVEKRLNETLHQVKQIDDQLKNIPKERGPKPEYKPPYYVGRVIPGSRDKTRIALEEKQHELKVDALSKTENDSRSAQGQEGRVVRDTVREKLFPNPYRQMSAADRHQERQTIKEIEQSQDYMDAILVERATQRDTPKQPDQSIKGGQNKAEMSMSARFSMSLNFTKATEKTDAQSRKSRERDVEPDRD